MLGWYIHHHGRGHLHRFLAVAPHLRTPVTVLSSLESPGSDLPPGVSWRRLPLDVPIRAEQEASVTMNGALHWAPAGLGGFADRMATIAAWIAEQRPAALVVDVSVEVALLARLLAVPVIWVAQHGHRGDPAHRLAYAAADTVIAPWTDGPWTVAPTVTAGDPAGAPRPETVIHTGMLSRFDTRQPAPHSSATPRRVTLLLGAGGHRVTPSEVATAAAATPDWEWQVCGFDRVPPAPNLQVHPGGVDVWGALSEAAVVVASASGNAVAEVAAARRPLICLPQPRPFDEQTALADFLVAAGVAQRLEAWPNGQAWPGLLEAARRQDVRRWDVLHDRRGAARFAEVVDRACA